MTPTALLLMTLGMAVMVLGAIDRLRQAHILAGSDAAVTLRADPAMSVPGAVALMTGIALVVLERRRVYSS